VPYLKIHGPLHEASDSCFVLACLLLALRAGYLKNEGLDSLNLFGDDWQQHGPGLFTIKLVV